MRSTNVSSPRQRARWLAMTIAVGAASSQARAEDRFGQYTATPATRLRLESLALGAPRDETLFEKHGIREAALREPLVDVHTFGAVGDGVHDDTQALQRAIASLSNGGTIVLTPGRTYLKRGVLRIDHPGVTVWGYGARLYSIVTDDDLAVPNAAHLAVHLCAPDTHLYGVALSSNLRTRTSGNGESMGILATSRGHQIVDTRLEYLNIFVQGASYFSVARNVVYRSLADGIHVTGGSNHGVVVGNLVRQTGDDMIAVVDYGPGQPDVGFITIEGNDVADQYWGRGISTVGGHDIEITGNRISNTPIGAGILVHSETSYDTADVERVRVTGNVVRFVQTGAAPYNPLGDRNRTQHAAIDVQGQGNHHVSGVLIENNEIENSQYAGIRVLGNSCDLQIVNNKISSVNLEPLLIRPVPRAGCPIRCQGNAYEESETTSAGCSP